jgi:hypothetical protein
MPGQLQYSETSGQTHLRTITPPPALIAAPLHLQFIKALGMASSTAKFRMLPTVAPAFAGWEALSLMNSGSLTGCTLECGKNKS